MAKIPEKYLKAVLNDPELFSEADVRVQQQIWVMREDLFESEVQPLIQHYLADKLRLLRQIDSGQAAFFRKSGKARRQMAHIQRLVAVLGDHVDLYDRLLQYIRKGFQATGNLFYCSLRFDLLMALHDSEVSCWFYYELLLIISL